MLARTITVYLVDVHPIVREDLAWAIEAEPDLILIGQTGSAIVALEETGIAKPDVVLVDLDLPDTDESELVTELLAQLPSTKLLVMITGYELSLHEVRRAGAHGFLFKSTARPKIIESVRRVIADGTLPGFMSEGSARAWRQGGPTAAASAPALGSRPPSLVTAASEPDDEPSWPPRGRGAGRRA